MAPRGEMKKVSFKMPTSLLRDIDTVVSGGLADTRSAFIRNSVVQHGGRSRFTVGPPLPDKAEKLTVRLPAAVFQPSHLGGEEVGQTDLILRCVEHELNSSEKAQKLIRAARKYERL